MMFKKNRITNDLDFAVDCFRPVLNALQVKQGITAVPVFLSSFPQLRDLNNSNKWIITLLKARLVNKKSNLLTKYNENNKMTECFIILDEELFINSQSVSEMRNLIFMHEFCHFLALFYVSISIKGSNFNRKLKERLSKSLNTSLNEKTKKIYQFFNDYNLAEDLLTFDQVSDRHFRLGMENMSLNYMDLFKNLLLPRQMFDVYFTAEPKDKFFNLIKARNMQEAYDLYINVTKKIAQDECLPEKFAINQALHFLRNHYLKNFID